MSPKQILLQAARFIDNENVFFSCTAIRQADRRTHSYSLSLRYVKSMSPDEKTWLLPGHIYAACNHSFLQARQLRVLLLLMFRAAYDDLV